MEDETKADQIEVTPAVTDETKADSKDSAEQDSLKTELDKVQRKGRTKVEKLQYTKKRIDEQLKELGVEDEIEDDEDEKPVTVGMLKKIQAQTATKTALQLADEIPNETERELTKYHLENTIRSTGNPQEDFTLAQNQVNAVKNKQILEELGRKTTPPTHGSNAGAPANKEKQEEFTPEEQSFMKPPFNLTKEAVIKARSK